MITARANKKCGVLICQGFGVMDRSEEFNAICDILNTVREVTQFQSIIGKAKIGHRPDCFGASGDLETPTYK